MPYIFITVRAEDNLADQYDEMFKNTSSNFNQTYSAAKDGGHLPCIRCGSATFAWRWNQPGHPLQWR